MKKHTLLRILFVIPLVLAAVLVRIQPPSAKAKGSTTCSVYQRDGDVFSLADCDSFQFVSGWIAINKGLINDYQKGALITVSVKSNGYSRTFSSEFVKKHWTESFSLLPEDLGLDCPSHYIWYSDYYLPLGELKPGTYTIVQTVDPKHPLKDGFANVCTWADGSPITEVPALYTEKVTYTNTFEVTAPNPYP